MWWTLSSPRILPNLWVCLVVIAQSYPTLCNPTDCSLQGSSVHGILQARIPEWVASPFSRGSALPGTEPGSPTLQPDSLLSEPPGKPYESLIVINQLDVMRYIASPLPAIFPTEILTRFSSVQFSCSVVSNSLQPHESQHARSPCPSPIPGVHSNSCPLSRWCHPAISSSVIPFSSCLQSLPASESFPKSQLFTWGGQSTGVSALASFLPKKSQGWSPSEWTGWISLQSKGCS